MLKAKTNTTETKGKSAAIREILFDNEVKRLNVNIPKNLYARLKLDLATKDMTISDWIRDSIDEYLSK